MGTCKIEKNTLGQNVSLKQCQKMHEKMSVSRNLYLKIHYDDRITILKNAIMNREKKAWVRIKCFE